MATKASKVHNTSKRTAVLVAEDGVKFDVGLETVKLSGTLSHLLDEGWTQEEGKLEIPITRVKGDVLAKCIEFCEYLARNPSAFSSSVSKEKYDPTKYGLRPPSCEMTTFEKAFFDVSADRLYEYITAANFLDIRPMLLAACKAVASIIIELKNPEELRKHFNLKNDFTPEESARISKELQLLK
eukprot:CAMPEP_0177651498 /NCGR_PEP_ID=MMETSP0447-20121125/12585_1 /TAXON_ID=0 /ORGANISM="Stygamoeba regulata, Strain BSH-02190019" /LENGTH=183 /DNA_ID=CAMNT_0019154593 /DNA_START=90 /DNA_END=641 /DNA_ORIENTATION=+